MMPRHLFEFRDDGHRHAMVIGDGEDTDAAELDARTKWREAGGSYCRAVVVLAIERGADGQARGPRRLIV